MGTDANGVEQKSGGKIPVEQRNAYHTYSDKEWRTNAGVLVANYPVTSCIEKNIFPAHNGFVTANLDVVYVLNDIPVMTRKCQVMLCPDKSEATVHTSERFFAASVLAGHNSEMTTITREQFELLKEIWS